MITYEQAYEIAKKTKPNIDCCVEYENGYFFGSSEDELYEGGYGHEPIVVLKSNGTTVLMPYFLCVIGTGETIKEFEIE